jgi:hypothetical protein
MVEIKKILEFAIPIIIVGGFGIWLISQIKPPVKVGAKIGEVKVE